MKPFFTSAILFILILSACKSGSKPPEPDFVVTVKNETDQVSVENREGSTVIDIQSPSGIGWARFDLDSGTMPERIIIKLHLAGLEEFRFSSGETALAASFSSGGVITTNRQTYISSGKEIPLSQIHPYWLNIRVISNETIPTIPLKQGYFEVEIPGKFLNELGNTFEVYWIDFYR